MAEEIKDAVTEAAPEVAGADPLVAEIKETVKDVIDQVEKLPGARKIVGAARDVAEEVEKSPTAAKVRDRVKGAAESIEKSPLLAAAHRVLLAGIGVVGLAQDEIEDFVARLVERGEIAEADGRKMLKDVLEKRKSVLDKTTKLAGAPERAADELERRIEDVMARMNVPSKDEIATLSAKITALTKKVEELKKQD